MVAVGETCKLLPFFPLLVVHIALPSGVVICIHYLDESPVLPLQLQGGIPVVPVLFDSYHIVIDRSTPGVLGQNKKARISINNTPGRSEYKLNASDDYETDEDWQKIVARITEKIASISTPRQRTQTRRDAGPAKPRNHGSGAPA